MVKTKTPGPRYGLPSTTGFVNHDPTRPQAPAFSFGVLTKVSGKAKPPAPGPKYDVRNLNEHGILESNQASVLGRFKSPQLTRTPGPKYYKTDITEPTSPAFTFGNKRVLNLKKSNVGPGPNKYMLPSCIGPHIPHLKAEPAFSLLSSSINKTNKITPGPKYMLPLPDTYLKVAPRTVLLGRASNKTLATKGPGPNKYFPKPTYEKQEALKGISFGLKHSDEKRLVQLPEDKAIDASVF